MTKLKKFITIYCSVNQKTYWKRLKPLKNELYIEIEIYYKFIVNVIEV